MERISVILPQPLSPSTCIRLKNGSGTGEDVFYSIGYEELPAEFKAMAEKDLNETEVNKAKGVKRLQEYIKKEKLPGLDDFTLITILRNCKFNVKKSETKLKNFLRARETIFSKMESLDLKKVELIFEDNGIGLLPYRDKLGRAIMFTRPEAMNEELYSMEDVLLTGVSCAMFLLSCPLTSVAGMAYIGGCKFRTASSYVSLLKAYHQYMWTFLDLPIRVGRIELTNENLLTRWFFKLVRPFLSSKILSRISFCGDRLEDLHKAFHPDILPEEFGGNMGPLDSSFYKNIAVDCVKRLKAESRARKDAVK